MKGHPLGKIAAWVIFAIFCALALWAWRPGYSAQVPDNAIQFSNLNDRLTTSAETLAELIAVTNDRPLFHASRKPQTAPDTPTAPAAPKATLMLVGIIGVGGDQIALVRLSTNPQLYQLKAGDQLDDWQITDIGTNTIQVIKDGIPEMIGIGK